MVCGECEKDCVFPWTARHLTRERRVPNLAANGGRSWMCVCVVMKSDLASRGEGSLRVGSTHSRVVWASWQVSTLKVQKLVQKSTDTRTEATPLS